MWKLQILAKTGIPPAGLACPLPLSIEFLIHKRVLTTLKRTITGEKGNFPGKARDFAGKKNKKSRIHWWMSRIFKFQGLPSIYTIHTPSLTTNLCRTGVFCEPSEVVNTMVLLLVLRCSYSIIRCCFIAEECYVSGACDTIVTLRTIYVREIQHSVIVVQHGVGLAHNIDLCWIPSFHLTCAHIRRVTACFVGSTTHLVGT